MYTKKLVLLMAVILAVKSFTSCSNDADDEQNTIDYSNDYATETVADAIANAIGKDPLESVKVEIKVNSHSSTTITSVTRYTDAVITSIIKEAVDDIKYYEAVQINITVTVQNSAAKDKINANTTAIANAMLDDIQKNMYEVYSAITEAVSTVKINSSATVYTTSTAVVTIKRKSY